MWIWLTENSTTRTRAGQLASIDAPLANDTITFSYDQLGRVTNRSINPDQSGAGGAVN